jgi:ceramide glucosyltransferase
VLPISVLKPVKGVDVDLAANINSFFELDYPKFELIFSIADWGDLARPVIEEAIARHPRVRAQLIMGDVPIGMNPKVNNLIRSYNVAKHDLILISDSNIRVAPDYLHAVISSYDDKTGVVTAIVRGDEARGVVGWLEAVFLNTYYARFMLLAKRVGAPVVLGKSMLFRRSVANRFGGLSVLARYLAEDYMAGQAMRMLGLEITVMREPVVQPIGRMSLRAFWSRHLRWGRIRKSQAPLAFVVEPVLSLWVCGAIGAVTLHSLFQSPSFASLQLPIATVFATHVALWMTSDLLIMWALGAAISWRTAAAWLLREIIHLPMWCHIASGNTVNWRGRRLTLSSGGILKT